MLTMRDGGRQLQQLQPRLLPYFHAAQKIEIDLLLAFMRSMSLNHILLRKQDPDVMFVQ